MEEKGKSFDVAKTNYQAAVPKLHSTLVIVDEYGDKRPDAEGASKGGLTQAP